MNLSILKTIFSYTNHAKNYFSIIRKNCKLKGNKKKPKASEVLTSYLKQTNEPSWTSYFVKWSAIINDQSGMSVFNWSVGQSNYLVMRVACFPYIKYHCTKERVTNLEMQDKFYRLLKIFNLGIPCLAYGIAAFFLISHKELVWVKNEKVFVYFLIKEETRY